MNARKVLKDFEDWCKTNNVEERMAEAAKAKSMMEKQAITAAEFGIPSCVPVTLYGFEKEKELSSVVFKSQEDIELFHEQITKLKDNPSHRYGISPPNSGRGDSMNHEAIDAWIDADDPNYEEFLWCLGSAHGGMMNPHLRKRLVESANEPGGFRIGYLKLFRDTINEVLAEVDE